MLLPCISIQPSRPMLRRSSSVCLRDDGSSNAQQLSRKRARSQTRSRHRSCELLSANAGGVCDIDQLSEGSGQARPDYNFWQSDVQVQMSLTMCTMCVFDSNSMKPPKLSPGSDGDDTSVQQLGRARSARERAPLICKGCGQEGHKQATCRNPPRRTRARRESCSPSGAGGSTEAAVPSELDSHVTEDQDEV
jgi:hypothetical protein